MVDSSLDGTLGAITPINDISADVAYTPDTGFIGMDSFTFIASNGIDYSAQANVGINVVITVMEDFAIALGDLHSCAIRSDGSVYCWGRNHLGQLGNGLTGVEVNLTPVRVTGITDAVGIAVGYNHSCAIRSDGSVYCWGSNQWGQLGDGTRTSRSTPVGVIGITDAVEIALGD